MSSEQQALKRRVGLKFNLADALTNRHYVMAGAAAMGDAVMNAAEELNAVSGGESFDELLEWEGESNLLRIEMDAARRAVERAGEKLRKLREGMAARQEQIDAAEERRRLKDEAADVGGEG